MTADDRLRLKLLLRSLDEAALVALANVGLVRRARKDLEAGGVAHEETAAAVVVRGPDWSATIPPDGPTKATDSTQATGVTRHILAATIFLRDTWAADAGAAPEPAGPPPGEALADALLAISAADLQKWAGKNAFKEALALNDPPPAVEVEAGAALALRLVRHGVEARLFPGSGTKPAQLLDAIKTTGPKSQHVHWALAAVLAFQASRGKVAERAEPVAPAGPAGAPVTRQQLLASARQLFASVVAVGLAHPSERTAQRLFTLSVTASALVLPRLARLARSLSDDVRLALARNAAADPARLFERLCVADALARALLAADEPAPLRLAGRPRTEYEPCGERVLAGVGAYPWQSASGFEGVTVLFWDLAGKRFLTWTASRPVTSPGRFTSDAAYRGDSVWKCGPAERLSRSLMVLRGARVNPAGRLSGSKESAGEILEPVAPHLLDFGDRAFADWAALAGHVGATEPVGLAEPSPMDRVVVARPAAWGERVFDESRQCLRWELLDGAGRGVDLVVPWVGVNEPAVEFLEAVNPARDGLTAVVARAGIGPAGLELEPLSLLGSEAHRVLNPGFDRGRIASQNALLLEKLRAKYGRDRVPTTLGGDDDDAPDSDAPGAAGGPVGDRLREYEVALLALAEAGGRRPAPERLRELAGFFRRAGLSELGEFGRTEEVVAGEGLLAAGYAALLHRQAARAAVCQGA